MKKETLDQRGIWKVIAETLTDGSIVYDVTGGNVRFFCADQDEAIELFAKVSGKSARIEPDAELEICSDAFNRLEKKFDRVNAEHDCLTAVYSDLVTRIQTMRDRLNTEWNNCEHILSTSKSTAICGKHRARQGAINLTIDLLDEVECPSKKEDK